MTRQEQFKNELRELLIKYDVEISLENDDADRHVIEFFSYPISYEDNRTPVGGIVFQCRFFDSTSEILWLVVKNEVDKTK